MQIAIASHVRPEPAAFAGLLLSALLAQALSPARAPAQGFQARAQTAAVFGQRLGSRLSPSEAGSGCADDIASIGHLAAYEIGQLAQAGVAQILALGEQGASLEEISYAGYRTVQFVMFRAGDGRTEVYARLQACLDPVNRLAETAQRQAARLAAAEAFSEISLAVDQALNDVQTAIWVALQE